MIQHKRLYAVLIALLLCVAGATAAGIGVLSASDATNVVQGENGTLMFNLTNDFDPKLGTLTYKVYYDETVANAVATTTIIASGVAPADLSSPMTFTLATASGVDNGNVPLFSVTFTSLKNDGSSMEVGLEAITARDVSLPPVNLLGDLAVLNGTFTTKDEVAPVIDNITTPSNVQKNFQITGYITEVGGMGTANATLTNGSCTRNYDLTLTNQGSGVYTYTANALWDVFENGLTLTVNAVDAAGNPAIPKQTVINIKDVGFSNPSPVDYINTVPAYASVFMSQIDTSTVNMTLGGTIAPTALGVSIVGDYARGNLTPLTPLADGEYWVNATGTDTIASEDRYLNWTFVLDTTQPTLAFSITDTDGDGYNEARENLILGWVVSNPGVSGFKNVALIDTATAEVLWSDTSIAGGATLNINYGNRDLSFRAYDNAGNYGNYDFHLYNNYIVWINSTKIGTVSGIDTEYTAMMNLDHTATSMITLYNGRSISAPDIGTIQRQVENVGQVTSDTYVTVDNRANATYAGTDTYQTLWVYNPGSIPDFQVTVPEVTHANVLMMEANESYLAEIIDSGSRSNINYTQLVKRTTYIFINGGWTKLTVNDDGSFTQDVRVGTPITAAGNITQTLKNAHNQVNLTAGFRLSTDSVAFNATTAPDVGDYTLMAIAMDGDRIGIVGAMPVVILETNDHGSLSTDTVVVNSTFDASVNTTCKYFGVSVYRDTEYNATASLDFSNLNYNMLTLNLTAGGEAATEQLWHNIYISPDAGKYATVKNDNSLTFNVSGLAAGSYKAVLTGLSDNGTGQAFGVHDLVIRSSALVANFTGTPTSGRVPLTVQFNDTSTGNPTTWSWTFGDGQVSSLQNPIHIYNTGGYRTVTLEVTNALGNDSLTRTNYIYASSGGGGGGGGGGLPPPTPVTEFKTTGTVTTNSDGIVQESIKVLTADEKAYFSIPEGIKALDANGLPLKEVIIQATDDISAPTSGFTFAGHAIDAFPAGATFDPAITLTFQLTEEEWANLPAGESFVVRWFNAGTGAWENVPTYVNPTTHRVIAKVTHFSTFAVFMQEAGVVEPTPTTTAVVTITPVETETTPVAPEPPGEFPWTIVIGIIVILAIICAGYWYYTNQD
ncbi:MAG: PKD domain-containing protein [Methanogenium sp.]|nr:PKD domain-containing protein [Methanogenium sp.]